MKRRRVRMDVKDLLEEAYARFATPAFIAEDPVQVPRSFADPADAEVMGFLTATIAWGQRRTIITNAFRLARLLDDRPAVFIREASDAELAHLDRFVHRTFQGIDLRYFVHALRNLLDVHGGLENAFLENGRFGDAGEAISRFKDRFFALDHPERTRKHVADPRRGSNAKRINMFLRWMVRPDDRGVDLGLWKRIHTSELMVPLDVHTGRVARDLGLLKRGQDDWKSVVELTEMLRQLDPHDPVRFDLALFGLGVSGGDLNP